MADPTTTPTAPTCPFVTFTSTKDGMIPIAGGQYVYWPDVANSHAALTAEAARLREALEAAATVFVARAQFERSAGNLEGARNMTRCANDIRRALRGES